MIPANEAAKELRALIHYWNFNEEGDEFLLPTYSWSQAALTIGLGFGTFVEWATGQGFWGENARLEDEAGSHLRLNNPLGASVVLHVPSTGFRGPVLRYESRRSGQGAGTQQLFFSTNGITFDWLAEIEIFNEPPQVYSFDLSEHVGVDDNPNLAVVIAFAQGAGGTMGNNRFDNITLEGIPLEGTRVPPQVVAPIGVINAIESGAPIEVDLNEVFVDLGGDTLEFEVAVARPQAAGASVSDGWLSLQGLVRGETAVTVSANDGHHPAVPHTFRLLVQPEAHLIRQGEFRFEEWPSGEPEHSYPVNMLFVQSAVSDPVIDTPLDHAYFIPADDYAATDSVGFPYNNASRTRINGLASEGISFINTGRGRDLGGAVLSLDTREVSGAQVSWLAGTRTPNSRIYALRLQYRIGIDGPFQDVLDPEGQPLVYTRHGTAGHTESFGPVDLPGEALDQPHLQLLWRYHHVEGESGPRAELRLDDIVVVAEPSSPFEQWQAANFTDEEELADPLISGPLADPDDSGIPNLVRYAFGLSRTDPHEDVLPRVEVDPSPGLGGVFYVYRRLMDPERGVQYDLEVTDVLSPPRSWRDAVTGDDYIESGSAIPTGDGLTEEVTLQLLRTSADQAQYFRLRVVLLAES